MSQSKWTSTFQRDESGLGFWRRVVVVIVISLGLIGAATITGAQAGNPNPGVIPINAKPHGLSYREWSARWWDWVLSIPPSMNPNLDTTGAFCTQGQSGHVWFLAETFGGSATRTCAVPAGTMLFFPILNGVFGSGLGDCPPGNPGGRLQRTHIAGISGRECGSPGHAPCQPRRRPADGPERLSSDVAGIQLHSDIR